MFHESFFTQYAQSEIDIGEYFPYLLRYRMLPAVFLGLAGGTKFKKTAAIGTLLWTGFSAGIVAAASVLRLGARGMLLCIAGMLPHFFFYSLAYIVILWYLYHYPQSEWNAGMDHVRCVSESGNRKMVSEIDLLKDSGLASQTLFACHNGEVRKEKVQI